MIYLLKRSPWTPLLSAFLLLFTPINATEGNLEKRAFIGTHWPISALARHKTIMHTCGSNQFSAGYKNRTDHSVASISLGRHLGRDQNKWRAGDHTEMFSRV